MSDVQYPFIDVAVHDRVSEAFAAGMAVVVFSPDLRSVSWANGRGAALFGFASIYDFLDQGLDRGELMFRQVEPVARSLSALGDRRTFTVRIASGFLRVAVQARCEMIRVQNKPCILLSVPVDNQKLTLGERAARLIEGFDDPETHMAVLDEQGTILSQSGHFAELAISVQTARMLVSMVGNDRHRLIKRPISTSGGYLPAAIGQVSEDPSLNLLFVVGAVKGQGQELTTVAPVAAIAAAVDREEAEIETASDAALDYEDALNAVAAIEDTAEVEEEISLEDAGDAEDIVDEALDADEAFAAETAPDEDAFIDTADEPDVKPQVAAPDVIVPDMATTEIFGEEASETLPVQAEDVAALTGPITEADAGETDTATDLLDVTEPMAASDEKDGDEKDADDEVAEAEILDAADEQFFEGVEASGEENVGEVDGDVDLGSTSEQTEVGDQPSFIEEDETVAVTASASATPDDDAELAPSIQSEPVVPRPLRTVRFVWKIDASGRFSEVSREFADAVGPHAADISGMAFSDLAALFNLDPDGKIAELLGRRDTWSGRTIWWPVEGTSLVVPVDLAALPTYTRSREFDGFRGFGIVRMGDAAEDPNAAGLSLGVQPSDDGEEAESFADAVISASDPVATDEHLEPALDDEDNGVAPAEVHHGEGFEEATDEAAEADLSAVEATIADAEAAGEHAHTEEIAHDNDERQADETPEGELLEDDAAQGSDLPNGERPALALVDNPGRRHSDKVIRLEEHRSRLSPGEQANFQEIARRLDTFVKSTDGSEDTPTPDADMAAAEPATDTSLQVTAGLQASESDGVSVSGDDARDAAIETIDDPVGNDPVDVDPLTVDDETGETAEDDLVTATADNAPVTEASGGPLAVSETSVEDEIDEVAPDESEPAELHEPIDAAALAAMMPGRDRPGLSEEIIDQMPVALLVHAGDRLIHANGEFLKMTGYASLDALAEIGGLDALLQRQELEDKTTHAGGMVVVREDDVIVPVTARLQSIRWNDASALMLALMPVAAAEIEPSEPAGAEVLPLRPLRNADQLAKLQVEVDELRAILETATDGVVIIGAEGDIRSMNRAASALFNFDGEEINGKPFVTLFAHESQRAIIDYLSGLSGHGVASVLNDGREVIGREASGGFLPLFMTIGKLTSSNGYCAVIRDITQWKRTEEELRTAKRAAETANAHKSEFLAHVSHEIRTPLNAIIGFADMMASERLGPVGHPRYIEYSNDIGRSGRHVLDIVNDLLDISKIEAGELDLDFVAVGLNETVSEAVSLVQPQANGQRVIIRTALSQTVPQVVADLRSIKQIVLNVLSNAIRFTPSGGQIVVSTAYEGNGSVVLRIRDTGIGMTRAELELAMKPFRQVAGTSRKRGDGTGLGLPLTKAMVDANRANFAISSTPNEGTLVEITFPSQRVLAS